MHTSNMEPNRWKPEKKRQTMRILNSLNRPQEQKEEQRQALDDIRQEYEICLQSVPESLDDALSDIDENAYLNRTT